MSSVEVASSVNNETVNNEQEQNSDFVYWINGFGVQESSSLNYPFDKWQTLCVTLWTLIFIVCMIVLILMSRK